MPEGKRGWDETENSWRYRLEDPQGFVEGSFWTKEISNGVNLVLGKWSEDGPMKAQAVVFSKEKFERREAAQAWLDEHAELTEKTVQAEEAVTLFAPFVKVDEERRMVYGTATDETPDAQDDVVDYEATKAAAAEWRRWRNVREMHQARAAGVAEEITLDDERKALDIGVKVVDDAAWEKVKAGVYKGFSIGGRVLAATVEKAGEADKRLRRITQYVLNEISLVDRPANPNATFSLVKREETMGRGNDEIGGGVDERLSGVSAELGELRKAVEGLPSAEGLEKLAVEVAGLATQVAETHEQMGGLGGSVERTISDLTKVVGDLAQVVQAVETLEERLSRVEKTPAGMGPVLREIGVFGDGALAGQSEAVLKGLLADADPATRELIGQKLTEMGIRAAQRQPQTISNR
jgi:hypothetical protein